jgi:hypothetical protein
MPECILKMNKSWYWNSFNLQETRSKSSEEEPDGDQVEMLRRMLSVKDYQENALKEELGRKK